LRNDLSAGSQFLAPTGDASLICLAWIRGGQGFTDPAASPVLIPVSESTRLCRWPAARLVMKSDPCNDLDGENDRDEPVDGGAERRPPPRAGAMPLLVICELS
jgi:hypothetical protein